MLVKLASCAWRTVFLTLIGAGASTTAYGQSYDEIARQFPMAAFTEREKVARWLLAYDRVAWITSDSAAVADPAEQQRLGPEWFCWRQDSLWHAFYGRYSEAEDRYDIVLHYAVERDGAVHRSQAGIDTARATRFARVIHASHLHIRSLVPAGLRMNAYVRERDNGQIEAWYLPAWQTNGFIIHGAQLMFAFDPPGRRLIDSMVEIRPIHGALPDSTQTFSVYEDDNSVPSIGSIFLMLAYHPYFAHVYVYSQHFLSSYLPREDGVWIHAVRHAAPDTTRAD
jgi:hypothetical protein